MCASVPAGFNIKVVGDGLVAEKAVQSFESQKKRPPRRSLEACRVFYLFVVIGKVDISGDAPKVQVRLGAALSGVLFLGPEKILNVVETPKRARLRTGDWIQSGNSLPGRAASAALLGDP
jgi:hypothetical protein